jgi:outer membrane protein, heavy metal efflux system
MWNSKRLAVAPIVILLLVASGCTVHPQGETAQRQAALKAGVAYERPFEDRRVMPLPANPSTNDLVRYALLTSADLERRYWEWRSAIEQIPQDGTQPTNLAIFAGTTVSKGTLSFDRTTITAGNDPMADILWPGKVSTAARRALENARAAGFRFQKGKYDLRSRICSAYDDYAVSAELIRLEQANTRLLQTTVMVVEARERAGAGGQQDLLRARNELDLSRNDIASMQAQLPGQRAALNTLLNREPDAALPVPPELPGIRALKYGDGQLLAIAARQNPELAALAAEIEGRREGLELARLQYLPDFSVSAGADLAGIAQTLMGMVTVPLLRYQALNAAIAQAQSNLRATEALRRQTHNDLNAQVVMDLVLIRDDDRQLQLFEHTILPRARQMVSVGRSAYETGQSTLLDFLDNERSLIAIERLAAKLRVARDKSLADLEDLSALELGELAR